MPKSIAVPRAAMTLLERRLAGERVEVTDQTRPLFLELVAAGLMEAALFHQRTGGCVPAHGGCVRFAPHVG